MSIDYDFSHGKPEGVFLWNGGTATNPNNFDQSNPFLKPYSGFLSSYDTSGKIHNGIVFMLPEATRDIYVRCRAKFDVLPTHGEVTEFCLLYSQKQPPIGAAAGDETLNVKLHDSNWITTEHGGGGASGQLKQGPPIGEWFQFWAHYKVWQPAAKNYSKVAWSFSDQEPQIGSATCVELIDGTLANPIDRVLLGLAHTPSLYAFADLTISDEPIGDFIGGQEPPVVVDSVSTLMDDTAKKYNALPAGDLKDVCGFLVRTQKFAFTQQPQPTTAKKK